ncbi:efflux RND transporter periplasmic adaptor subunit [Sinimarinibacterium thermocellulolyticum]|uniref:Efflux RND transporter periplasmic adaptor subunit n=1 Tax=Sinimarinibacterium thermocellulolyticum TaxID=3170016 RepID=A0ABV2AAG8_9GAMM
MNDTSNLLGQLRIDPSARQSRGPGAGRWALLALAVVAAAATIWLLFLREGTPVIATTTARAAPAGGSASASVLDASGYVVARRRATVSSKLTGKVVEVLVEEGMRVEENQILARIDDINARAELALAQSRLDAARAQLAEVRVQRDEAHRQLRRTRSLAERKLVSEAALDTAQAEVDALEARLASTQAQVVVAERAVRVQQRYLEDTVVRAPFAGVITVKNAQPGEMISPLSAGGDGTRTGIGTLVDMDSLEIEVDVNENFINRVTPGQPAIARLNAYPDWEIPAEVIAVIPTADRSKATVTVRVGFKQKDPRILPEMGVRVAFREAQPPQQAEQRRPGGVLVDAAAVQIDGDTGVVFVVRDQTLERRAVRIAGRSGGEVRVVSGLTAGDVLALGDLSQFRDGMAVKLKP